MRKSERLNAMMIYLKDKEAFNLAEIIASFGISRSTALRDIASLEELGLPIYSEPGRYGGYRILENRQVPPICFTRDEVFALYFSMLTLKSYQSTPFHLCFANLKKKFAESISKENAAKLAAMERVLRLEASEHYNESPSLKRLVEAAVDKEVLKIVYSRRGRREDKYIQVMDILARDGEWYCTAFDFVREAARVYRCDCIEGVESCGRFAPLDFIDVRDPYYELRDLGEVYFDFEVEIDDDGVNVFRKEHYPNMVLAQGEGRALVRGYYGEHEEMFMARYLMKYGKTVGRVSPPRLAAALRREGCGLLKHYKVVLGGDCEG